MGLLAQYFPYDIDKLSPTSSGVDIKCTQLTSGGGDFNGAKSTDNVSIGIEATWSITFKLNNLKGTHLIDMRLSDTEGLQPIYIYTNPAKLQFHSADSGKSIEFTCPTFETGLLYTIIVRAKQDACDAFLNGEQLARTSESVSAIATFNSRACPVYIGTRFINNQTGSSINGAIYDARIYDHFLSDEHIEHLTQTLSNITIFSPSVNQAHHLCQKHLYERKDSETSLGKTCLTSSNFIENEYTTIDGAKFLKIFEHNVIKHPLEYFSLVANSGKEIAVNRFSRLKDLRSDLFRSKEDGKYEFIIDYPDADLSCDLYEYAAGNHLTTGIYTDWTKSFHLEIQVNIPALISSSEGDKRYLIIGNYSEPGVGAFNIELYNDNKLRVYINDDIDQFSIGALTTPGKYTCYFKYDAETSLYTCELKNELGEAVLVTIGKKVTNKKTSPLPLCIGGADYRTTENPFKTIKAKLIYPYMPVNGNRWKQSICPFYYTSSSTESDVGYQGINIYMQGRWGDMTSTNGTVTNTWGCGLGLSSGDESAALLDCQPLLSEHWWGGLGQSKGYAELGNGKGIGFPACDGKIYQHVCLWVRVDNTPFDGYTAITSDKGSSFGAFYTNEFIEE